MSYDLRDIKSVRILAVAKKLGMKLGFRDDQIRGECSFRFPDDGIHEPLSLLLDRDSNKFRCLSCSNGGSVLDLVCQVAHIGPSEAIEWVGQNFCLPGVAASAGKSPPSPRPEEPKPVQDSKAGPPTLSEAYNDFLRHLGEPSAEAVTYMQGRGISLETLETHRITDIKGYHGTANFLKDKYPAEMLRQAGLFDATGKLWFDEYPLILPYRRDGKVVFLQAHCMDSGRTPRYLRPRDAVPVLYNVDVLRTLADGDRVFLVEGAIDCLTLEERGYPAVAVVSMNNFKPHWVEDFRGLETYVAHNGEEGAERAASAMAVLFAKSDLGLRVIRLPRGHDVNSFFAEGGTQPEFEHLVQTAPKIETGKRILEPESRMAMAEFLEELRQHEKRTKSIDRAFLGLDTGFPVLNQICGGLDPLGSGQVCLVTGLPGVGKTTFCLQMAWQILQNNETAVLHVSYDEGRFVLRLKTMCQLSKVGARSVLRGDVQADRLASAVEAMSRWGKAFFIVEGNEDTTVEIIRDYCERIRTITGEARVVVIVDNLEAVPSPDGELRQIARMEASASKLHLLSRKLAIPVVVVSSTAMGSSRGTLPQSRGGGLNYREDTMFLLEPDAEATKKRFLENEGVAVNLHVAKNRAGGIGSVALDFLPDCHHFAERGRIASPFDTHPISQVQDAAEIPAPPPVKRSIVESKAVG
jgi:hypothetical protein